MEWEVRRHQIIDEKDESLFVIKDMRANRVMTTHCFLLDVAMTIGAAEARKKKCYKLAVECGDWDSAELQLTQHMRNDFNLFPKQSRTPRVTAFLFEDQMRGGGGERHRARGKNSAMMG